MAVTIQFNTGDDLKIMESLLRFFREAGVQVQIVAEQKPKTNNKKTASNRKQIPENLTDQLHGVLKLPVGFDYKSALADDLLKKHTRHG